MSLLPSACVVAYMYSTHLYELVRTTKNIDKLLYSVQEGGQNRERLAKQCSGV